MPPWGGYAEYSVAPAITLVHIPEGIDFTTAAAVPVAYATSHVALKHKARLQPGEHLLVTGASGGVGLTAVELGAAMGAHVIASASSAEKLAVAKSRGAEHLIDSSAPGLDKTAMAITGGKGVNVVYDAVGGEQWDQAFKCAAFEARMLVVGFASSKVPQIPANQLLAKNVDALGFYIGAYFENRLDVMGDSFKDLMDMLAAGKIKPLVSDVFTLDKTKDAIAVVRDRKAKGKVIVVNNWEDE